MICHYHQILQTSFCLLTTQVYSSKTKTSVVSQIVLILVKISQCINANKLSFNINKTKYMLFQNTQSQVHNRVDIVLHGDKIENVDHFKFLGIWIDKNLNWKKNKLKMQKKFSNISYRIIPYRHAVRECEGLGAHLLVIKRGPNHDLPLWVKSASKSDG